MAFVKSDVVSVHYWLIEHLLAVSYAVIAIALNYTMTIFIHFHNRCLTIAAGGFNGLSEHYFLHYIRVARIIS